MVLGLGSRSRKDGEAPQVAEVEVCLHAIKPWQRTYCQSASAMVLQWSRGETTVGSSKVMAPVRDDDGGIGAEKIAVDESFRASMVLTGTTPKKHQKARKSMMMMKKKRSVAVLDVPFVFHLFHSHDLKQPLAQATLDLTAIDPPTPDSPSPISLPLTFFKVASKGSFSYLHLSVLLLPNPNPTGSHAAKPSMPLISDEDKVPVPTLDLETQRALVAALLSDEDDASIASFTDDDEEQDHDHAAAQKKPTLSTMERQSADLRTITPSVTRVLSVTRDAAVAASTAYSKNRSFLGKDSKSLVEEADNADTVSNSARQDIGTLPCNVSTIENGTARINPSIVDVDDLENPISTTNPSLGSSFLVSSADKKPVMITGKGATAEEMSTHSLPTQSSSEPRTVLKGQGGESQQGASSQIVTISEDKYKKNNGNGLQTNSLAKNLPKQQNPEQTKRRAVAQSSDYVSMTLNKEWKGKTSKNMDAGVDKRKQNLEYEMDNLKGELTDVAALESAVYSTTAEHSCSSFKLHAPARRLARTYEHTYKYCSQERRANCAKNIVTGLVLAARSCGNDVPRLTFWWSNAVLLREIISRTFNVFLPKADMSMSTYLQMEKRHLTSSLPDTSHQQQKPKPSNILNFDDWIQPTTLMAALERLEGWIYTKVMELIWWQVFTPQMLKQVSYDSSHYQTDGADVKEAGFEFGDDKQGSISVEIWKKAFLEACDRLCPVQRLAVKCGCLPMLNKMVLEACVVRLDIAMFNAVLRDNEAPTDPISDPISNARVLPIPTRNLSFGVGAQLKNSVASLSTWLINVILNENEDAVMSTLEDDEKARFMFPLLKAIGGVLMVPKDMLLDEALREEVCPLLSRSEIVKILSRFRPDELSPEPVTTELLHAMSAGVEDMNDNVRLAPSLIYCSPDSGMVRHMITEILGNNSKRAARKGHTSDDEIDELDSSISWLLENTEGITARSHRKDKITGNGTNSSERNRRFQLLSGIWTCRHE